MPLFGAWILFSILRLAPGAVLAVHLPSVRDLAAAARSHDDVELERIAARLGIARLSKIAVADEETGQRLAALRAIPLLPNGWSALEDLVMLIGHPNEAIANAALDAVWRVTEGLSPARAELEEIPRDIPSRAARRLLEKALDDHLAIQRRVGALFSATSLRRLTPIEEPLIVSLLKNAHAEVRRAAAETLAGIPAAEQALSHLLEADLSALVAAAAGISLCRDIPVTEGGGSALARGTRIPPRAHDRLRALALDETIPILDRLELLPCLHATGEPTDQKILDQLAKVGPKALRRKARALGGN
jgi:hypothetical protein